MYRENELQLDEIAKNNSEFTEFTLYRIDASNDDIQRIVTALHNNTHVTSLTLDGRYITLDGVRALSNMIVNGSAPLKTLSLNRCGLSTEGLRLLQDALEQCQTLTSLSLNSNPFGEESGLIFASIIKKNPQLEKCALNEAEIGAKGAEALAQVLGDNESVQHLSLALCGIGDSGAEALSKALMSNNKLRILNLKANGITDVGAKALIDGLMSNTSLEKCELNGEVSAELQTQLKELVLANELMHGWEKLLKASASNAPIENFVKILPFEIQDHILKFIEIEKNSHQTDETMNTEIKILENIYQEKIKRRQSNQNITTPPATHRPSLGTSRHGFHAVATSASDKMVTNLTNTILEGKFNLYSDWLEKATESMQVKALQAVTERIEKNPALLTEKVKACVDDLKDRVAKLNQQAGPTA